MKKNTKAIVPVAMLLVVIGIIVGIFLFQKFSPSKEHMTLASYYKAGKNDVKVILNDEILDTTVLYQDRSI